MRIWNQMRLQRVSRNSNNLMNPFAVCSLGKWGWSRIIQMWVHSNFSWKSWIYLDSGLAFSWSNFGVFLWELAIWPGFPQYKQRLLLNCWACSSGVSFPWPILMASTSIGTTSGTVEMIGRVEVVEVVEVNADKFFEDDEGLWPLPFVLDLSFHSKSCWCRLASTWIMIFSQPIKVSGWSMMLTRLSLIAGFNPFIKQLIFVCSIISR